MSARKLEETDELKHKKVDKSLSKAIMQARMAKKMTQKELATAINEKPQVIGEYESGKAIPNGAIIVKMERKLDFILSSPFVVVVVVVLLEQVLVDCCLVSIVLN